MIEYDKVRQGAYTSNQRQHNEYRKSTIIIGLCDDRVRQAAYTSNQSTNWWN